ncbi:MAG TPA: O-acetyltransferase [Clostridiales bacterium]|jgi:acetyltransferase-like isoleucine patch superfamily enzyme|nr:O-acetyltransferase [Clostridiales bacterium]
MAYISEHEINKIGLKSYGKNVLISDKAVFYYPENISIGNNVRIDDFCVLVGNIIIKDYIHMALFSCLLSNKNSFIEMNDYSGISYQSIIFTSTDDFSGQFLTNPTIPNMLRNVKSKSITIGKHCLIGAGSLVYPGANMGEGAALGAKSFLTLPAKPWKIYLGNPAYPINERDKKLLVLEEELKSIQKQKL